jgi:hypothetical protein
MERNNLKGLTVVSIGLKGKALGMQRLVPLL